MKPTIYTIAKEAKVSIATVSRAFNNHPRVSEETRATILQIAADLGYQPSASARNLATSTTETLALVLPFFSGQFFSEIIRGAETVSRARHYHLLVYSSQDLDAEDALLSLLPSRIDGLILVTQSSTTRYIRKLDDKGFPFVILGYTVPGLPANSISPDNFNGAYELTRHLIEAHGYDKIAFICGPGYQSHSRERLLGYTRALQEHGIPVRQEWIVPGKFDECSGHAGARKLLGLPHPPRAIFAGNDLMAVGALAAASEMGLSVPDDLAIAGFDDVPSAQYLHPPLTTVSVGTFEQGAKAAEMLLECVVHPSTPRQEITLPTPLVVRRSCGCNA
jgi:LacI family transcriptional regulator